MRCPFCGAQEDRVVDTRPSDNDTVIRRRRECEACQRRFTTYERIELELPSIVKKDGRRESFDRTKLLHGFKKALEKRPIPVESMEAAVEKIERTLQDMGEKEVPSTRIGDAVMSALRELDDVAYLRFASVYLSPRDVGELLDAMQVRKRAQSGAPQPPPPADPKPAG